MLKNTFYILIGCIALALLAILWYSIEIHLPFLVIIAFIAGVIIIYFARSRITNLIEDERDQKITEQATIRTMQVFWVAFCAFSIAAVMEILHIPEFPRPVSSMRTPGILPPRLMGYIQLGLLCLMIFLYVGFRIYYARKYGEWDTDEE